LLAREIIALRTQGRPAAEAAADTEEIVPEQTSDDLLTLFDAAPLNRRYWVAFTLLSALFVLEFFDFLVVGYLLAVLAPQWHLTYGQSAVILYSGGVGAILGALVFGGLSDAWGRKITMIIGTLICAASSGLMGIVPSGSWEVFAVLRFFIGVGLTAGVTPSLTIQVELTPTRHRTLLTSFYLVFASAGGFLASGASAALLQPIGWRGVAMLGMAPAVAGVLIWFYVPESVRWLVAKGRFSEARAEVAKHLGMPLQSVPLPTQMPAAPPRGRLSELYRQPSLFWETVIIWGGSSMAAYGVYLWGPTIVAMVLSVPVPQAAKIFCLRHPRRGRGQNRRHFAGAADRPALAGRGLGVGRCRRARRCRLLQQCHCRGVAGDGDPAVRLYLLYRGRLRQSRALHRRALRRASRRALVRPRAGRERRRQDCRPIEPGPDRRQQQCRIAAGDLGGGAAGLSVPRLLYAGGRDVVRVSRR